MHNKMSLQSHAVVVLRSTMLLVDHQLHAALSRHELIRRWPKNY